MVNAEKWSYAIEKSRDWVTSPVTLVRFTGPEGKMAKQETPRLDGPAAWDDYRPGGTQRFLALDTLRGVAILMVVFGHFLPDRLVFGSVAHHVNSLGRGGVILFFLLSGYLIFRNVERQDTATFLSRRLFKIFPAYSVNVALIFALGYFNSNHANWNLKLLLANLFMVQDVFGQDLLNGVYWTLLIEIKFYAFIALQYLLLRDRGTVAIMVILIAVNSVIWWTRGYASLLLTFFPTFYIGIQIYRAERSNWDRIGVLRLSGSVALVAFSLLLFDQHYPYWSAAYLIGEAAALSLFLRSDIWNGTLNFFGRISYSDYLYHASLGFLLFALIGTATSWVGNLAAVALAIVATTAVAYVSFRYIEVPMVAFGKAQEPKMHAFLGRLSRKAQPSE
jgi:peptidoglycan/LPS O-acetylase OafA/YrhL